MIIVANHQSVQINLQRVRKESVRHKIKTALPSVLLDKHSLIMEIQQHTDSFFNIKDTISQVFKFSLDKLGVLFNKPGHINAFKWPNFFLIITFKHLYSFTLHSSTTVSHPIKCLVVYISLKHIVTHKQTPCVSHTQPSKAHIFCACIIHCICQVDVCSKTSR